MKSKTPRLDTIQDPQDLRELPLEDLPGLASEIRSVITDVVLTNGGHLGSNLGVVDLTLALYHVFDISKDLIIWDGSYQTYTHKLLTGRRENFDTLRTKGGIAGFQWKPESPYDAYNSGHVGSGPALALGAAVADERLKRTRKVISLIGDGSMTSGVAFEAFNNIGASGKPLMVILNDNGVSITKTVGAFSTYLNELRTLPLVKEARKEIHRFLEKIPLGSSVETALESIRRGVEQTFFPNIFTAFGFDYYGPIDGHDIKALHRVLKNVRDIQRPVLLHVLTKKGKGYPDAEGHPYGLHKPLKLKQRFIKTNIQEDNPDRPEPPKKKKSKSYTRAFSDTLRKLTREDDRIVAITAAMPDGTGLLEYAEEFPERVYDVGISEQCAIAMAAGLAHGNLRPFVAIYSSFTQRGYDQIFQEMCLNRLPVTLILDRAGIAGEDGPTHHGNFDIASCRPFPEITLMAPKDERELEEMLRFTLEHDGPCIIRLPRESVPDLSPWRVTDRPVDLGRGEILIEGKDGAILAYGVMAGKALQAAALLKEEGIDLTVANARFAKPLDVALAEELVKKHPFVLTLEDHGIMGGFGSAVLEALSQRNANTSRIKLHGIPDRFILHAHRDEIMKALHLDPRGIADVIRMIQAGRPMPKVGKAAAKYIIDGK